MGTGYWLLICLGCLIAGYGIKAFWRSRKIDETIEKAKQIARDPSSASQIGKEIGNIWK